VASNGATTRDISARRIAAPENVRRDVGVEKDLHERDLRAPFRTRNPLSISGLFCCPWE
jgi:hypothetical protein